MFYKYIIIFNFYFHGKLREIKNHRFVDNNMYINMVYKIVVFDLMDDIKKTNKMSSP